MTIGIVNDCRIAVEALRRALALNPAHRVVWIASNGTEAVRLCASRTPDLILMDLLMPEMDGVEATRRIMARTPCAILIVTVSVEANSRRVFEAMGHGALDAIDTPLLAGDAGRGSDPLLRKIETLATLLRKPNPVNPRQPEKSMPWRPSNTGTLVAIGASAGGPAALAMLLGGLSKDFPASLIVVQHVDQQFAAGMAEWLGQASALPVRLARPGDRPTAGTVLLAGARDHLVLRKTGRLEYTSDPRQADYRPSIDVFFHSVSRFWRGDAIGVLLTGMGRDGALGLKTLRNQGHLTIAQDQASSAVYGMPKAAAALGAAVDILPLERIAPRLAAAAVGGGLRTT